MVKTKKLFSPREIFDDKIFTLLGTSKTKKSAMARKDFAKSRGWNARIVKQDTGTPFKYGVYIKKNR